MISEQEIRVLGDKTFVNQAAETEGAFNLAEFQHLVSPEETLSQLRMQLQEDPFAIKITLKEVRTVALSLEYKTNYDAVDLLKQCVDIGRLCIDSIDKTPDDFHDIYSCMLEIMRYYYLALKAQGSDEVAHEVMQQLMLLNDRYNEINQINDKLMDILPLSAPPTFSASDRKMVGTQTSMTMFAQRPVARNILNRRVLSRSELEACFYALQSQLTFSGKHDDLMKLQQIMWRSVVHMVKKNPKTRTYSIQDEMIKMLELALSIEVTYIIYYKPVSQSPYRLARALQSNAKLFRLFNDYYQRTDASDDLKEQLTLNVAFMYQQATNVRHIILCEDVLNNETLTQEERAIALDKLNLSLGDWTSGFKTFMISQNNILLAQSVLKIKDIIERLTQSPCNEYDCVEYINGNPTHSELALVGQLHLIFSSLEENDPIKSELWGALQIYYQQKILQFEKTIDIDLTDDQQTRNFIDHERFVMNLRRDAYEYLLSDNLMSDTVALKKNCVQLLENRDYLTPLMQSLIAYHLDQIPPVIAISTEIESIESKQEISQALNKKFTQSKRKKVVSVSAEHQETVLDALLAQNIHRLPPEWAVCKHKVELLLQEACTDEAMLFLQEWIQELNSDEISLANQFHGRKLFYATFYKALIYKAEGRYSEALNTLDQLEQLMSSKEHIVVRNYQQQQVLCERGNIHALLEKSNVKLSGDEKVIDPSYWFVQAKAVAKEINVPCFPALCKDLKHCSSENYLEYQWTIDYLLALESSALLDDYSFPFLIEFYTGLANRLTSQAVETFKRKIYSEVKYSSSISSSNLVIEFEQAIKIIQALMSCSFSNKNRVLSLEIMQAKIYMERYDLTRHTDDYKAALASFFRVIKQVSPESSFALDAQDGLNTLKKIRTSGHEQRLKDVTHELTVKERVPKLDEISGRVYDAMVEKPFDMSQRKEDMLKSCTYHATISYIRHVMVILLKHNQFTTREEQQVCNALVDEFDIGIGRWLVEMKICFDEIVTSFEQSFAQATSQHDDARAHQILGDWCEWIKIYRLKIEHLSSEQELEYQFKLRRLDEGTTHLSPKEQQRGVSELITAEKEMLSCEYRRLQALMIDLGTSFSAAKSGLTSSKPTWLLRDILPSKEILDLYKCKAPSSDFNFGFKLLSSHRYWQALHYFYQVIEKPQLTDKISKRLNHYFIGSILKWAVDVIEMPEFSELVKDIPIQKADLESLCVGLRSRSKSRFTNARMTNSLEGCSVVNNRHLLFTTDKVVIDVAQEFTGKNDIEGPTP